MPNSDSADMPKLENWPTPEAHRIRIERREGCSCDTCVEIEKAKLVVIGVIAGWSVAILSGLVAWLIVIHR